ncbi:MAG TPA: GAF domain-containing sensor histidine kinase, partial [Mycobacteriales bacterium]|nr:GAF domain-containing sensor histidine kinase [Mycobacteriales bacterium]
RLLAASLEGARELGMLAEVQETTAMLANVTATGTAAPDRAPGTPGWPAASNAPGRGVLRPPDLSLLDRFDRVLHVGRAIAASLTSEAVYAEVRAAAFELLRGEESTVFLVPAEGFDGQRLIPLEETSSIGVGERLAARALASGRPELFTPEIDGEPADGLGLGTRSALAAPVFVRGRPVACLHVAHRQVRGLFGEDELRLAEFVATLAGAALENAEGFAAAQALSSSLEVRVAQRTEELTATNEVLRAALEELERVNEELRAVDQVKSDFVAMVSHELKTPLTSILGYCALMLRRWHSVDDEQKVSYIGVIESESQRLARMVHDLLNMSRIESGRLVTRLAAVGLADAVAVTLASYNAVPDDVATAIDPTLRVLADPDQLTQILINLIDNARRYGAAPISIRARRSGSDVVFSVSDLGPGVPAAFVPQLFEKFTQASTGPTRRTGGTGLGLSIVRGLVRAQGGDIWYEPNEPVGARFCVRLSTA